MPSRPIPNGKTVTLRLDADQVLRLKMTALQSGVGLSELIGALLGDALNGLKPMAHLEVDTQKGTSKLGMSPTGAAKPAFQPKSPAAAIQPRQPAAPRKPAKNGPRGKGSAELFQQIDAAIKTGKIKQVDVMREAAPGINPSNYRSSWASSGHVPGRFTAAVQGILDRLEDTRAGEDA